MGKKNSVDMIEPHTMLKWIDNNFTMTAESLSWMFQISPSVLQKWKDGGEIDFFHQMKIRRSYYFLQGTPDPHAGDLYCDMCRLWKNASEFSQGVPPCDVCKRKGLS